jgi:hypothetical protein
MRGWPRVRSAVPVVLVVAAASALAACGDDEEEGFSNGRIVDALGLEEVESGYAIGGDPFCEVTNKLLNDSAEVDDALSEAAGAVIASRNGGVGVEPVAPFAPDCKDKAKRQLNRLDPEPKEE